MSTEAPIAVSQQPIANSQEIPPMTDEQIREARELEVQRAYQLVQENERIKEQDMKRVMDYIVNYAKSQGYKLDITYAPINFTLALVPLQS